ncbi:MAG TPA: SDR family oxidoreductase [Dehalococcoidia bacterium]|nr:SDR family oxidoreductase [Dehalococcoidia bacterium]
MKDLSGRTAIVTGASRGLGVYIARALAGQGVDLVLAARNQAALEDLARELRARGRRAIALPVDLRRAEDIERLAASAAAEFGRVDLLVNNAGIEAVYFFHQLPREEVDEVIDVNLRATMHLTRLVLPGMLERREGHIVNMSSLAGKAGPAYAESYAATKAALIGFTQSLRASYRRDGVSASVICPGFVGVVGMYADAKREHGQEAPRVLGESRPEAVAAAVLKAVRNDLPEVIVNPRPVRALLAMRELAPGFMERMSRLIDANSLFRRQAEVRAQAREQQRAR